VNSCCHVFGISDHATIGLFFAGHLSLDPVGHRACFPVVLVPGLAVTFDYVVTVGDSELPTDVRLRNRSTISIS